MWSVFPGLRSDAYGDSRRGLDWESRLGRCGVFVPLGRDFNGLVHVGNRFAGGPVRSGDGFDSAAIATFVNPYSHKLLILTNCL